MKKGVTIIELVVSMSIFAVIMTLIVGAYVTVLRMRSLTGVMRESQQKIRIAGEMLTRLSRQAQKYSISTNTITGEITYELYFNIDGTKPTATKFIYDPRVDNGQKLKISECLTMTIDATCSSWPTPQELLGPVNKVKLKNFQVRRYVDDTNSWAVGLIPANNLESKSGLTKLNIKMTGEIVGLAPFYNDEFNVETDVILEGLR